MKKLLVVVDYQNDFVNGSLGFKKAEELEDKIYNKVKKYQENGDYVIFTYDTHFQDNYLQSREGRNLPILHCIKGTEGHKLYGKLKEFENENLHMDKYYFAIDGSDFIDYIGEFNHDLYQDWFNNEIESVELVGVVSDICVISNAMVFQNLFEESNIIVDASCCASFDDNKHESAMNVMESLQMKVINREEK